MLPKWTNLIGISDLFISFAFDLAKVELRYLQSSKHLFCFWLYFAVNFARSPRFKINTAFCILDELDEIDEIDEFQHFTLLLDTLFENYSSSLFALDYSVV